jgi:hypothetical protein
MADGFSDFLGSLIKPFQEGWQSTAANFEGDVDKVKEGGLPSNFLKMMQDMSMMSGSGMLSRGIGPGMGKIPGYITGQKTFDPQKGWEFIKEAEYPAIDPLKSLLQGNVLGSEFSDMLMKLLQQMRTNVKGGPW